MRAFKPAMLFVGALLPLSILAKPDAAQLQQQHNADIEMLMHKQLAEQKIEIVSSAAGVNRLPSVTGIYADAAKIEALRRQYPHLSLPDTLSVLLLEQIIQSSQQQSAQLLPTDDKVVEKPFSISPAQFTALSSATSSTALAETSSLSGEYLVYNRTVNWAQSRGRLKLSDDGTGQFRITDLPPNQLPPAFNWQLDNEGKLQIEYLEPVVESVGFISGAPFGSSSSVKRETVLTGYLFTVTPQQEGYFLLDGVTRGFERFPDLENEADRPFERNARYAVADRQIAAVPVRSLMPTTGKRVSLPWVENGSAGVVFGNQPAANVSYLSTGVELTFNEISATEGRGVWKLARLNSSGPVFVEEPFVANFHVDGSADFVGASGDALNIFVFKDASGEQLTNSLVHVQSTELVRLPLSPQAFIHADHLTFTVPKILQQTDAVQGNGQYSWLEFEDDGRVYRYSVYDVNNDGKIANNEFSKGLSYWQFDPTENKITLNRYRDAQTNLDCPPPSNASDPFESCRLFYKEEIAVKNLQIEKDSPVAYGYYTNYFYRSRFFSNEGYLDSYYVYQRVNRGYVVSEERPVALPVIPANDSVANAVAFESEQGTLFGSTENATYEQGEPCFDMCATGTVWYKFKAETQGRVRFSFTPEEFEGALFVLQGNPLGMWSSSQQLTVDGERIVVDYQIYDPAEPLYIQISARNNTAGNFKLDWRFTSNNDVLISTLKVKDAALQRCINQLSAQYAGQVTYLSCGAVSDISGIEKFKHLQFLYLRGYDWSTEQRAVLTDLVPITELQYLRGLQLADYQLTDEVFATLQPLQQVTGIALTLFDLNNNKLTNASLPLILNLIRRSGFISLYLSNNLFIDLPGIEEITELRTLDISSNSLTEPVTTLNRLTDLPFLQYISANGMPQADFSQVQFPASVQNLNLMSNNLSDLEFLGKLPNAASLQTLQLSDRSLQSIAGLRFTPGLQYLYLYDNSATDFTAFRSLTKLRYLTEYSGNFNDLSVLSGAAELQALYLNGAKLSDISNLKMLPLLRELHIYQSVAEDFTALSALLKLERLDLNGSLIADLSPIAKASNLNWLNLNQTRIKDLKPLYDKVKLQYLSIYGNTQLKCEDIFALRASLSASLNLQEPLQCVGAGYTLNLVNYVGSVATAEIRYVDEKYRELGELVFVNGVLTFKPKKGVSGFVSIPVWVIVGNSWYYIDVKFYVEAAKKRKKLPLWLYLTDSKP